MLKNVMENNETNDNKSKYLVRNRLYHPHANLE